MANRELFISQSAINDAFGFTSESEIKRIQPIIFDEQSRNIEPFLGSAFYDRLQQVIVDSETSGVYFEFIRDYLTPVLEELVRYRLYKQFRSNLTSSGLISNNNSTTPISDADYRSALNDSLTKAAFYQERIVLYLDSQTEITEITDTTGLYQYNPYLCFNSPTLVASYSRGRNINDPYRNIKAMPGSPNINNRNRY